MSPYTEASDDPVFTVIMETNEVYSFNCKQYRYTSLLLYKHNAATFSFTNTRMLSIAEIANNRYVRKHA